jgi:hypothetical protein
MIMAGSLRRVVVAVDTKNNSIIFVAPECFYRGSSQRLSGFPLRACGNDGRGMDLKKSNEFREH